MVTYVQSHSHKGKVWCFSLVPREAVLTAFAQSIGDPDHWQYEERYGSLIVEGIRVIACGEFFARKDGKL